jgi:hypothetical protein
MYQLVILSAHSFIKHFADSLTQKLSNCDITLEQKKSPTIRNSKKLKGDQKVETNFFLNLTIKFH